MVEGIGPKEGKELSKDMSAYTPEEVPLLFAEAFSAGDLETLISLYEPEATSLAQPGEAPVKGTEDIRAALQGFLASEPRFTLEVRKVFEADDLALSFADWTLTGTGSIRRAAESVSLLGTSAGCQSTPGGGKHYQHNDEGRD